MTEKEDPFSHISTETITKDIHDTKIEILKMEREERGLRMMDDRWSVMRADHRSGGIKKRKLFIEKLESILEKRKGLQK